MATAQRDEDRGWGSDPHPRPTNGWFGRAVWSDGWRRSGRRLAGFGMVAVAMLALTACGEEKPYSQITPASPQADDIQGLYKLVFWMALVVFVGVQFLIFYTALRFRTKRRLANRPEQIHGNTRLELAWTIIPAIVLLIIFVPTVAVMYDTAAEADDDEGALVIQAYGKQWWWEFQYPGLGRDGEPLITANEIRVPVGQKVVVEMLTNNVIHSFWVPQLAGKMDVIPGYVNKLAFTPEIPGTYYGECAEFCGTQHAWMRFTVIVEPREQFEGWTAAWNAGPQGDLAQAPQIFGACIACHRISNVAEVAPVGYEAPYNMGPNLTLFGCRDSLGAGILINTPENVAAWLDNPHQIKEGNLMGYVINDDALTPEQVQELTAYLTALKLPDGTCPPDPGASDPAATPVAGRE